MFVRALLHVCFLISNLIPLTSLAGHRSTAADLRPTQEHGAGPWPRILAAASGSTAPGCMRTRGRKRCVLEHTFFESDLTPSPLPPPLLSQDAGVRGCGREVNKGMSSRALLYVCFLISNLNLIPLTSLDGHRSTAAGPWPRMLATAAPASGLRPWNVDARQKGASSRTHFLNLI